jgi:hypothetical protein
MTSTPVVRIPKGVFQISIEDLKRQIQKGRVEAGPNGLQPQAPGSGATKVPKGTFHVSIEDLRRQVQQGRVEAGPRGLQPESPGSGATKVPPGTFHVSTIDEFQRSAPEAQYVGGGPDGDIWVESITDPVTGITVTIAFTSNDGGRTARAWCIDPDMRGHRENVHACHCYDTGEVCTDLHGVRRNLAEKRARAVLWVSGFANYLREGRFALDQ